MMNSWTEEEVAQFEKIVAEMAHDKKILTEEERLRMANIAAAKEAERERHRRIMRAAEEAMEAL